MPGEGEREMRKVVDVYLGLVCACERLASWSGVLISGLHTSAHDPVSIFADSYTRARFFELKVLQQFNPVRKLGVFLEAPFALADEPFGKRSCSVRTGDGVYRYRRMG